MSELRPVIICDWDNNGFRRAMTVFTSCMKHHTSEKSSCHLDRQLIYDYAWLARAVAGALTHTTQEQTSSCQLSQKTHRHAQTHYRPIKYTYSPNIPRNTFIKQLPQDLDVLRYIRQWAHSRLSKSPVVKTKLSMLLFICLWCV